MALFNITLGNPGVGNFQGGWNGHGGGMYQNEFYNQGGVMLQGVWINVANGGQCEITQQGNQGMFINERGSQAYGMIYPGRVDIPAWNTSGMIAGNRIVWPDGNYWERIQ
jgi:hypothetical protein